ncbi:MAG: hypothetical protein PUK41_05850 [Campylobacter hominis]|nr:hypothetical protein [Campylobacter hominis]MCI6642451.1 hypothetical protein [Campylobacter sp.]MDD7422869.1 hypothetical protein [Campylobacter hominis]
MALDCKIEEVVEIVKEEEKAK